MPGLILCAFLMVQPLFAQGRLTGQVVDVIDGRTAVIEVSGTRLILVLQLIDVPDVGQPLNKEVAEHLRGLLLKKMVEFKVRSMENDKSMGAVFLNNVDVGQQMLRDGGAWLVPPEVVDPAAPERDTYKAAEAEARADKLGIWSIKDLKPSWEKPAAIRAEQPRPASDKFRYSSLSDPTPGRPNGKKMASSSDTEIDLWADVMNGPPAESPGLVTRRDADTGLQLIATTPTVLGLAAGKEKQKLSVRALYVSRTSATGGKDQTYVIGLLIATKTSSLSRSMPASVDAEGQTITLGSAKRFIRSNSYGSQEMLFYTVSRSELTAIASARKSQVTIGSYTGQLDIESQSAMLQLLDASN